MICRDPAAHAIKTSVDGGQYRLPSCEPGWWLFFILSWGGQWEHVSVRAVRRKGRALQSRIPTWKEMCQVKDVCWPADDGVMQLHPPQADHINIHPDVLHLWRPANQVIPLPPKVLV